MDVILCRPTFTVLDERMYIPRKQLNTNLNPLSVLELSLSNRRKVIGSWNVRDEGPGQPLSAVSTFCVAGLKTVRVSCTNSVQNSSKRK